MQLIFPEPVAHKQAKSRTSIRLNSHNICLRFADLLQMNEWSDDRE